MSVAELEIQLTAFDLDETVSPISLVEGERAAGGKQEDSHCKAMKRPPA